MNLDTRDLDANRQHDTTAITGRMADRGQKKADAT
jgi:hypothetical protein